MKKEFVPSMHTTLLLAALILLIVGFPFFLFGVFLSLSQGPGGMGDVAVRFSSYGFLAVSCGLIIRSYLQRRRGWLRGVSRE